MATNSIKCVEFANGYYTGGDESRSNYIRNPSNYEPSLHDLSSSDSGRNQLGVMINNYSRRKMKKQELSWDMISALELHYLLVALYDSNTLNITCFDVHDWSDITYTAYISSDIVYPLLFGDTPQTSYHSVKVSLIEM